jgi:hypothetical protein
MHPLEKGGYIATIVAAVFCPIGVVASCYSAYASWVMLHQHVDPQSPPAAASGNVWSMLSPQWLVAIFVISVICGVGCIALFVITLRKRLKPNPSALGNHSEKKSGQLLENRPKIYPTRYGKRPTDNRSGLFIRNDGETAFSVMVHPVKIGTSLMNFWSGVPVLTNDTGEVLVENHIKLESGTGTSGTALMAEMAKFGMSSIQLKITYKDGENRWYVTECELEREVLTSGGIAVKFIAQNITTEPKPVVTSGAAFRPLLASIPLTAPRPYLEVEDPIGKDFGKTLFHFTNRGGDVAHNIQVQPLTINRLSVVFDLVPVLAVNETKTIIPTIPGTGIMGGHDILNQMEKEWEGAWEQRKLAIQKETDEWETKILITYEDFTDGRFEATADLVVFPTYRILRNRHALEFPQREYKTVEVRNIKFRRIL